MYAQTNVQLFDQLQRNGYTHLELSCVLNAYKLAMRLFTGIYRPSGETFITHQVGTASILSSLHVPAEVVAAGLTHAAYTHGDFGGCIKGISAAKREHVRRAVGKEVEAYIARYTALTWKPQSILTIRDSVSELDLVDRHVVVMRLADVLEKYQDREILYHGDLKRIGQYLDRYGPIMVEIASQLSCATLAAELEKAFRQAVSTTSTIPAELRCATGQRHSFLIAPQSYRERLRIVLYREVVQRLRAVRARIGVGARLRRMLPSSNVCVSRDGNPKS